MDRRIEKTKSAIYDALLSLMSEKDFEKITISNIAERANINRGTVYSHFIDKYDLLDKCIESYLEGLFVGCSSDTPEALMLHTFNYLEQHSSIFLTLLNEKSISSFRNRLLDIILQSLEKQAPIDNKQEPVVQPEISNHFFASGVVGVLEWWITQSMPYSSKDMVENFMVLTKKFQD